MVVPGPSAIDFSAIVRAFGESARDDFASRPKPPSAVDLVTLDTNLVHDHWKERPRQWAIEQLLALARNRQIDLVVTRYIRDDVPDRPLHDRLDELPGLKIGMTGGLITFDYSTFGGSDFLGSGAFLDCQRALSEWRPSRGKPPDERDWNHLHAHYAKRRDRFLTWDGPLLELGGLLEEGFPLGVIAPDKYLTGKEPPVV
jgi:hypothetical protein